MRQCVPVLLLSIVPLALTGAEGQAVDALAIDGHIRQLGSPKFREREAACKALKAVGEPALNALRQVAATSKDVEVRSRAQRLIEAIEKELPYRFNGKDLTGWMLDSGPKDAWQVVNGAIVTRGRGSASRGWLLSERTYGDFLFTCQFQVGEGADGGVGIRAEGGERISSLPMHLAIKLRDRPAAAGKVQTGSLYYWLNTAEPPARPAISRQAGAWNDLTIELRGQKLRVTVNGQEIQNLDLDRIGQQVQVMPGVKRTAGRIGLQQHSGEVRFRDIHIRDVTRPAASAGE